MIRFPAYQKKKVTDFDNCYVGGEHKAKFQEVKRRFDKNSVKASILGGIFPDETGAEIEDEQFCFCHYDCDTYQSAKDVAGWLIPRLCVGGTIIFDDYGNPRTQGVAKAVNEIREENDGVLVVPNMIGQAIAVKVR